MKNLEIAALFEKAADILALLDENTFKVLAFRKIARALEEMPEAIEKLAAEGKLEGVAGIGKSSAEKIREYLKNGKVGEFQDLLAQIPAGVLQIMKIPSVGPKTAALLWHEGGITTVEALKLGIAAATAEGAKGGLLDIKGVGAKKLQKIGENLARLETSSGRVRLGEALPVAEEFVEFLRSLNGVTAAQYCGSLRRGKETIGDIDIAVAAGPEFADAIGQAVCKHVFCASVIQVGTSKTSIRTSTGLQIDVRVVPAESFGAAIQYFTGSKEHNVKLREMAVKKGLKVNEWGVYRVRGKEEKIAGESEESVYAALGLAWIPPELREDRGEIEAALLGETVRFAEPDPPRPEQVIPVPLPSGNSKGDTLHSKFRKEILEVLEIGFRRFLPEVRWVDLSAFDESLVAAFEAALVDVFKPLLNSQKLMSRQDADTIIAKCNAGDVFIRALESKDWTRCDSQEARDAILKSIVPGSRGAYLFRAVGNWTLQEVGYVGKAAVGKRNQSDLRYRLKDHFVDDSRADDFVNKFCGLLKTEGGVRRVGKFPVEVVELQDIRGDLHMHTKASDGSNSIEELVAEAKRHGYEYIAVTDHSKSQFQANGLKADRLLEHIQAIHAVAKEAAKSGVMVLAGSEVDILADGSLDYEDDLLEKLDWVVASPHAALTQEHDAATARLVRAASNPLVCVVGHPTGRIVPSRRGLEPDMAKVIFAAARAGTALEINANYHRLDLRDVHVKMAVDSGVPLCIDTDTHALADFAQMRYGILTARRGWAAKANVLNTRTAAELQKWLKERRAGW